MHDSLRGERLSVASNKLVQCADVEKQNGAQLHMRQCSLPHFDVMILSARRTLLPRERVDVVRG